ncbi:MAG: 16S rRNA (guanine(527)-N(7))-methyltransferase RsmG [Myxococcaceae bacterium]|nr:16S rRNA (guanine(527)-N(7))-methyltransferase RsmG [Myxococcaceae bacterium]
MLRWNERVNLTAITDPLEVIDKHLLDSLAVLQDLPPGPQTVLDLGAGAGLPGIPWAIVRADLKVTLVDAVQKKVAFMKTAIATLNLTGRARAIHLRASGAGDGLGRFQVVVSRAFMNVERWLPLASEFVAPGGVVVAMVGQVPSDEGREEAAAAGLVLVSARRFTLPLSGDGRGVLVFRSNP